MLSITLKLFNFNIFCKMNVNKSELLLTAKVMCNKKVEKRTRNNVVFENQLETNFLLLTKIINSSKQKTVSKSIHTQSTNFVYQDLFENFS